MVNSTDRTLQITVGNKLLRYLPETKRALDVELVVLNTLLYTLVFLFAYDLLPLAAFLLLFYAIDMRTFIANHDRMHTDNRVRLPKPLETFAEGFALVVTPWDEPYDSIRRKHLKHHAVHSKGEQKIHVSNKDPHSVYESGGLFRVIFSCLFYEEIQLFFDIRNGSLSRSRLYRFMIYTPLLIAFILSFGWAKFLIVVLAMRFVGFSAWFVFSWVIHQPWVYHFGFSKKVPALFKWTFALLHGMRVTEGCLHHATHHIWPSVPYNQLHQFDGEMVAA